MPSEPVVVINDSIVRWWYYTSLFLEVISSSVVWHIDYLEVIVFALIPIGQVPEDSNVFKGEVVPFVGGWVVWNFVRVDVFSSPEDTLHLDELPAIYLRWSVSLVFQ